jgi:uncharacterized protein YqjF (DUF2071 family)
MFNEIVRHIGRARAHTFSYGEDMPLFTVDWHDAVFAHFSVDPRLLQPAIPFALDARDGTAYVSLVAFTQRRMRPSLGGPVASWLITPIARHEFLNLRTYVRVNGEPGIHFIAEWIPNRLAVLLGPRTYGLPYRLGRLRYARDMDARCVQGRVTAGAGYAFAYDATYAPDFAPAPPASLDEFLLERYVAFTHHAGVTRRFQVDHAPWPQQRIDLRVIERTLLALGGAWSPHAQFVGANFSPGVSDVIIGAPRVLQKARTLTHTS